MSAPVDVLAVMQRAMTMGLPLSRVDEFAEARNAVAELLDFVRASPCYCSGSTALSTGATLPAVTCTRCELLARAGGAA